MKLYSQVLTRCIRCTAITVGLMLASLIEASPEQYLSQLYTEILGRLPTPADWAAKEPNFTQETITVDNVRSLALELLNSSEFEQLGYNSTEKAYIFYRALNLRDPNSDEMAWLSGEIDAFPITTVINTILNTDGYNSLLNETIRAQKAHGFLWSRPAQRPSIRESEGLGNMTGAELQSLLNAANPGDTVLLAQGALITLDEQLIVPPAVTLATFDSNADGNIFRQQKGYARMARLFRNRLFNQPLVRLDPGSRLLGVWVDGRRSQLRDNDPRLRDLSLDVNERFTFALNVSARGGTNPNTVTEVSYCKLSDSCGWTTVHSVGSNGEDGLGFTRITNNFVSSYEADRDLNGAFFTDGISAVSSDAIIHNNEIVDPSDVGIVIFNPRFDAPQRSQATNNRIFFAGVNGWGGITLDHSVGIFDFCQGISPNGIYDCQNAGIEAIIADYSATLVQENVMYSSNAAHANIGISVGVHVWGLPMFGRGSQVIANQIGTEEQPLHTAAGITVSGMRDPIVLNNTLNLRLDQSLVSFYAAPLILDPSRTTLNGSAALQPGFTTSELWASLRPRSNGFVFGDVNVIPSNDLSSKVIVDATNAQVNTRSLDSNESIANWVIIQSEQRFVDNQTYYILKNRATNLVIEDDATGVGSNVFTGQANQYWRIQSASANNPGEGILFINRDTGSFLSRDAAGQVAIASPTADGSANWFLNKLETRDLDASVPLITLIDPFGELYQIITDFGSISEYRMLGNPRANGLVAIYANESTPSLPMGHGDINNDGELDIVMLQNDGTIVVIFNEQGRFRSLNNLGNARQAWQWDIAPNPVSWEKPIGFVNLGGSNSEDLVVVDRNGGIEAGLLTSNGFEGNPELGNASQLNLAGMNSNFDSPIKSIGSGDFNGDGNRELIFVNNAGQLLRVDVSGEQLVPAVDAGNPLQLLGWGMTASENSAFKPLAIADVNRDNTDDIVLVDAAGNIFAYIMNEGVLAGGANLGNPQRSWSWDLNSNSYFSRPLGVPFGKGWWRW